MPHEAKIVEYHGFDGKGGVVRRTVASGAVIPIGALLQFSTPNTVALHTASAAVFGGIAAEEKLGNGEDYTTTIAVYTDVVADLFCSASLATAGMAVTLDETPNFVRKAAITSTSRSGAVIVGAAQETTTNNGVHRIRVRCLV